MKKINVLANKVQTLYIQGMSLQEISEKLNMKIENVSYYLKMQKTTKNAFSF